MLKRNARQAEALKSTLIENRKDTSWNNEVFQLANCEIQRETKNWVPMWVDWGNSVRSSGARATAFRAITDKEEMLWYVRHDAKSHGYHSSLSDPLDAISEAQSAWIKRKAVRDSSEQLKILCRDLIIGRESLTITRQDAEDSALCALGTKWFLDRFFLSNLKKLSGRQAALLMKIEPQLGLAIHQAAINQGKWRSTTKVFVNAAPQSHVEIES